MRHWLVFTILACVWGASFILIKYGLEGFDPITLVAVRVTVASLFLGGYVLIRGEVFPRSRAFYKAGIQLGVVMTALPFFLISWGELTVDSGLAAILNATTPFFTALVVPVLHRRDPLTTRKLGGIVIGFLGVVVLMAGSEVGGSRSGMLAVLGGACSYGLAGVLLNRDGHAFSFIPLVTLAAATAAVIMTAASVIAGGPDLTTADPRAWASVVTLGIAGTGIAYVLFVSLSRHWGPTRSSMITYAIPIVGVALGIWLGGDELSAGRVIGGGLVLAGIFGANR